MEDVLAITDIEAPVGVIVQYGGQTPLKIAEELEANGVPILGTSPDSIDLAEDRGRFQEFVNKLDLKQPPNGIATNLEEAILVSDEVGFPLVVRPSYVLGGRAMDVVYKKSDLENYLIEAVQASEKSPVLLDGFLNQAIEMVIEAVEDKEHQIEVLGTFVRLGVVVWSGFIITMNYVELPMIKKAGNSDITFVASVFTGALATFGLSTGNSKDKCQFNTQKPVN